jgi:glycosyltransferase involved in cell wall biosynthesis
MKISVLIPTHNRPHLFKRCIESVVKAYEHYNVDLEIIVNNDSKDVQELYASLTKYEYNQSDNLSDIYHGLFERATKDYVYFLEDDDIMSKEFFFELSRFDEDILYFNYIPYQWHPSFITFFEYTGYRVDKEQFLERYDDHNFQFSQLCFRKECLDINDFPDDNCLQNDFKIFQRLRGSFRPINKFLYRQTVDGGDNISFKGLNRDDRWK